MKYAGFGLLAAYSVVLVGIELRTSQDYVRNFFTDIDGPVPFYAVNTTLSVLLLWSTGLLMLFAAAFLRGVRAAARIRMFYMSQAPIFALLGFDDRFLLHERLGFRLNVPDHYVLLVWAAAEVGLLALFFRPKDFTRVELGTFAAAVGLFGVMLAIDALAPERMVLRLSLEDLAKTWSAALFFLFAWTTTLRHMTLYSGTVQAPFEAPSDRATSVVA
jgi:hypothetical protein